ncbi:MAG: Wzz/FepE/Etk N-terminal domain-containing protein [Thermodesulfobacteriota bacterium]
MEKDTIELIDYLSVIWKRKLLILLLTLAAMITAGIMSFLLPRVYNAYSVVEIGTITRGDRTEPIEALVNSKTKIERVFIYKVMEALDIPEEEFPELEVDNPKGTRIVEISVKSENIDQALSILKNVNTLLLDDHKRLIEESKTALRNNIKSFVLKVNTAKSKKKALLQKLSLLKENRENIKEQIEGIRNRLKELLSEKKRLNLSANPDNTLSMLVFTSELQVNQRYYNELQDRLKFDIANDEVDIGTELNRTDELLETLELNKQNIQSKLDNLKETTVIKAPGYLKIPVKPKKKLNTLIAGLVGLMASLFLAFFMEYLEKVKNNN